jgi:hypothetical protein
MTQHAQISAGDDHMHHIVLLGSQHGAVICIDLDSQLRCDLSLTLE